MPEEDYGWPAVGEQGGEPVPITITITESDEGSKTYKGNRPGDMEYVAHNATDSGISKTQANAVTEEAARQYFDTYGTWPSAAELWAYDPFQQGLAGQSAPYGLLPSTIFTEDGQMWRNTGFSLEPTTLSSSLGIDDIFEAQFLLQNQPELRSDPRFAEFADAAFVPQGLLDQMARGTGRGGGGGGGGPAPFTLDRNAVIESIREQWRSMLLEEPDNAEKLADQYIQQAKDFRMKGGQLDLRTWTTLSARGTSRYSTLYSKKPEHLSEGDYMGGFVQAASQFGLNQDVTLREIEAGATSGTGLAGFTERVGRTREARTANQGAFSQKLANAMNQTGALMKS